MAKPIRIAADRSKVKVTHNGKVITPRSLAEARAIGKRTKANLRKGMSLAEAKRASVPSRSFEGRGVPRETPERGTEPPR